jgi:hypothetical protein
MGRYTKAEGVAGAIHEGEEGVNGGIHERGEGVATGIHEASFFYLY